MAPRRASAAQRLSALPELPSPGDLVAGRYRVDGELGRGGMGIVLAAYDQTLERDVALKLLLPEMLASAEIYERFCNEARSLAHLESRHIVQVLDFSLVSQPAQCAGLPCMVLERLRGSDLFSYAREHGTLLPGQVVRLALEACDGLAAAHAAGIVHRDLKPENLFVATEADGTEVLKVLDFGIARSRSARVSGIGRVGVGSPGYMAPEQVQGSKLLDGRADIWALGVVMYELLAQQPAFSADTPQGLCLQILKAPITPLAELCPHLPPALVYVVERCMERDPDRRFPNVAELAEALAPLDDSGPDSAAARARRRLEAATPLDSHVMQPPLPQGADAYPPSRRRVSSSNVVTLRSGHSFAHRSARRRRLLSGVLAVVAFMPAVLLLPAVAEAPALAPARAWSVQALDVAYQSWGEARHAWRAFWGPQTRPAQEPAASSP